ncbi:MAG: phospholipase D family protein [Massilia sp.]|nr:phospholipase D family protein [Aquabacterium sp.]
MLIDVSAVARSLSRWARRMLCSLSMATLTTACASLPAPVPRADAHALADHQASDLGRLTIKSAPGPDVSGLRLLSSGEDAMGALAALADNARHTLDLQYYLIHSDGSSRSLMQRVRAAADRGVHVRLLLDDLNTAGQDRGLLRLTAHPNIEVRLYNPFPAGRLGTISRVLASITDMSRINHRMHNKMFVADNALAITGGRNLGDAYFVQSQDSNFLDIDIIVAGPAVRALSATFDRFWNDPMAYPVAAVVGKSTLLAPEPEADGASKPAVVPVAIPGTDFARDLKQGRLKLVWARATVLADKPSKMQSQGQPTQAEAIADDVDRIIRSAHQELIVISPYFVPGVRGLALFKGLRDRGVKVRVLTNSLATTDAPAVHIGYARYRTQLLAMGVELHELRPLLNAKQAKLGSFGSSHASLHAKVVVVDRQSALVGSMNLDPRSAKLNSEMGVLMHSPEIAQQLALLFEEVSEASYYLSLSEGQRVQWHTTPPDPALLGQNEPEASAWLKFAIKLLSPFAPEEML